MNRYSRKRLNKEFYNTRKNTSKHLSGHTRYMTEEEDELIVVPEDEVQILDVEAQLIEIGNNLGVDFISSNGFGTFGVSENVEVYVRYSNRGISRVETRLIKRSGVYDCTKQTTTVDNLSVELQTCVLIIKDIKSKIKIV